MINGCFMMRISSISNRWAGLIPTRKHGQSGNQSIQQTILEKAVHTENR
ncbi:hypothetical protein SFC27_06465 [Bacillus licheniformis]|uniref:Uncharacterized protein n=1 Tax=Bacillus licheniformis TaxID=1402 RepID=A0AB37GQK5_BACLI|nr:MULTISPECIES: hypothetical protein [Bacillus]MDP4166266.1 hypothetical protein [Bacillota bacterium]KYC84817.1 hypothetical protein B4091_4148 [Bacillus licheniformis]MBM6848664.1 hypothetical protein [Bacillus licheniformis]MBU8561189.1 hypothetical protein [Bacillus licheniformis]MBU8737933.1 hypothetical protein [Bacillus licheniformis]